MTYVARAQGADTGVGMDGGMSARELLQRATGLSLSVAIVEHAVRQRMKRRAIEERDRVLVAMHDVRGELAASDLAEDAGPAHWASRAETIGPPTITTP